MNIKRIVAVAGLTLSMAAFSPVVFAQTNTSSPPAAETSGSASTTTNAHAHEMARHASKTLKKETNARRAQVTVERRIAAARGEGLNVSKANAEKHAGDAALQHGNRQLALNHYHRAEKELNAVVGRSGKQMHEPARAR